MQGGGGTRQLQGMGVGKGNREVHRHIGVSEPWQSESSTGDVTTHAVDILSEGLRLDQGPVMAILEQTPDREPPDQPQVEQ